MLKRACVLAAVVVLSGCLNIATVIRVEPDGSGTIEQTLLFNPQNVEQAFAGMGLKSSGNSTSSSQASPIKESEVRESARTLGEGVTLVSMLPMKLPDGYQGVRAKFAFTDISKLRSEDLLVPGPAKAEMNGGPGDALLFAMRRTAQGTSVLTATFSETTGKKAKSPAGKTNKTSPDLQDAESQAMFKAMFKGFRIATELEIGGQIVTTNADYVLGKRITLVEIDLESLMKDSKKLESLDKVLGPDASFAKARPYLKDIKGLKINQPVVTVEFR